MPSFQRAVIHSWRGKEKIRNPTQQERSERICGLIKTETRYRFSFLRRVKKNAVLPPQLRKQLINEWKGNAMTAAAIFFLFFFRHFFFFSFISFRKMIERRRKEYNAAEEKIEKRIDCCLPSNPFRPSIPVWFVFVDAGNSLRQNTLSGNQPNQTWNEAGRIG